MCLEVISSIVAFIYIRNLCIFSVI